MFATEAKRTAIQGTDLDFKGIIKVDQQDHSNAVKEF